MFAIRNKYLSVAVITLMTLTNIIMISCKEDEDDNKGSNNILNTLRQNAWVSETNYDFMEWGDNNVSLSEERLTLFFLEGSQGIAEVSTKETDSYFGYSSSTKIETFTYYTSGSAVTIKFEGKYGANYTLYLENNSLSNENGYFYKGRSITSDDKKWLESAKYYILPDDERCEIEFEHSWRYLSTFNDKSTSIEVTLSVPASEHASWRGLQSLTATYKGPGIRKSGYGTSYMDYQKQELNIFFKTDNDKDITQTESDLLFFTGDLPMTITVEFSVWDRKHQKEVSIGTEEIVITGDGSPTDDDSSTDDGQGGNHSGEIEVTTVGVELNQPGATLTGNVNSNATYVGFVIGLTRELSEDSGLKIKMDPVKGDYTYKMWGLTERTTYYYRAYAIKEGKYYWGDIKSFTTPATSPYTYTVNGNTYGMVLVEGGTMQPFYIMQTEIPVSEMDLDGNGKVIEAECRFYIKSLGDQTGKPFRLPTQEEWEYAARGGQKSAGYTYSGSNSIGDVAWYSGNSGGNVHDIATKAPNELGLYDMSGNYAEFCASKRKDLFDGLNQWGDILCGGSWKDAASKCKPSSWENRPKGGQWIVTLDPSYITCRLVYSVSDDPSLFNQ